MYRLLIVTENQQVNDMITAMQGWEKLGFKPPRLRSTMEAAVECLQKHPIDAIAVDHAPAFDEFFTYLDKQYPDMPMFQIASSEESQMQIVQELAHLLNRLNADDSNDAHDLAYNMQLQRDRWMKKLIGGLITGEELIRQMHLYRFRVPLQLPCVLARLEINDEDGFMTQRWHYGSDRLETALRNFFGYSHNHMLMHVAVISPEEVRILCYSACAKYGVSENAAYDYMRETVEQMEHYLGLHMNIVSVYRISGIRELCK